MKEIIDQIPEFLKHDNAYMVQAFLVIFLALTLDLVQRKMLRRLQKRMEQNDRWWDHLVVRSMVRPITMIIWIVGICFAAKIVQDATKAVIFSAVDPIQETGIIIALAWFLVRLINYFEEELIGSKKEIDLTTVYALSKLARLSVIFTASLVTLQTLGFSLSGVLAFGGIGGIAVGFAAKDLLSNFFGGLMIYMDRPFAVGDWVRSPDKEIEGVVEHIGWRLTRIRTFDKRPLYVPNSIFANIAVENPSRMTNRRIKETIGVRYNDLEKLETIIHRVKDMLRNHPAIDTNKTLIVNFDKFAGSSLDFFIYTFTKTTDWIEFHEVKQDVLFKISRIIGEEGAEIAFPTSTLHLGDEAVLNRLGLEPESGAV